MRNFLEGLFIRQKTKMHCFCPPCFASLLSAIWNADAIATAPEAILSLKGTAGALASVHGDNLEACAAYRQTSFLRGRDSDTA